jgi:hypothetical protein
MTKAAAALSVRKRRGPAAATAVVLVVASFSSACAGSTVGPSAGHRVDPPPEATVTTSDHTDGRAGFQVGDDYTQQSHLFAGTGGNPGAVASTERRLRSRQAVQDVALMGWGTGDPEPQPGVYQWASLDSRVEVMGQTVPPSQRMITLCSAPGWMKVGGASQEWNMTAAVAPAYFEDFAQLAAGVAQRYDGTHSAANGQRLPQVDEFDVWNSLKGFWDSSTNNWDVADYTTLYNDVYRAIKAVRPDALVGGPYAPVGAANSSTTGPSAVEGPYGSVDQRALDAVTYWLAHKVGAQFLSVAGGPAVTDETGFAAGRYFVDLAAWLHARSTLPLVWAEFYPGLDTTAGDAQGQKAVAVDLGNMVEAGAAGVEDLMLGEMEGGAAGTSPFTGESVWTTTAQAGGGKPTPLYGALRLLRHDFPPGTALFGVAVSGPVVALAGKRRVLVVSESATAITVAVDTHRVSMAPYSVLAVPS